MGFSVDSKQQDTVLLLWHTLQIWYHKLSDKPNVKHIERRHLRSRM